MNSWCDGSLDAKVMCVKSSVWLTTSAMSIVTYCITCSFTWVWLWHSCFRTERIYTSMWDNIVEHYIHAYKLRKIVWFYSRAKATHPHHIYAHRDTCNWERATVCLSVCLEAPFTLWPEKDGCYYTSNHKSRYDRERWQVCLRQERRDIKEIDKGIVKAIEEGWAWRRKDRLIERE